jgi:predicted dehydrogenase
MIGFAICGAGRVSVRHAKAIQAAGGAMTRVFDTDAGRAESFGKQFGARPTDSFEGLLEDPDTHVVAICTPPSTHAPLAVAAMAAGKHVIVEKPFAACVSDLDQVTNAALRFGRLAMAVSQHRYSAAARYIGGQIRTGAMGRVRGVSCLVRRHRADSYFLEGWKGSRRIAGGGSLIGIGFHCIDVLCEWLGLPESVAALSVPSPSREVESCIAGVIRFPSGILASFDVATGPLANCPDEIELIADAGRFRMVGDPTGPTCTPGSTFLCSARWRAGATIS